MSEVQKTGGPLEAPASTEELKQSAHFDAQRAERRRIVAAKRESFRDVSPEEIERETAKAIAEVQAEIRAEQHR